MTMQMYMADERRAAFEEGIQKGVSDGIQKGLQLGANQIVVRMFRRGKSLEDIAKDTDTPVEAVRDMLKAEGLLH